MRAAPHRNYGCRVRDFVWRGRRCLSLENEIVRIVVAIGKGCDIVEFTHKPTDTECLYQAPGGLPAIGDLPATATAGGPFRDLFPGGWYLMLPNGPGPCSHAGADWGHHGEATLLTWDASVTVDTPDAVEVVAHVRLRRIPLLIERHFRLERGTGTLLIGETVSNESDGRVQVLWGHHPTFAAPLVESGTLICLPAGTSASVAAGPDGASFSPVDDTPWPMLPALGGGALDASLVPPAEPPSHDFVTLKPSEGWFALVNAARGVGFALMWDLALLPVLGLWRLNGGAGGYPWWGTRRMLALEPACDLPSLADAAARGTAIVIEGGGSHTLSLEASVFTATTAVTKVASGGVITASP